MRQHVVKPLGFHVYTSDIWDENSWSDPIYHDVTGIDKDVSYTEMITVCFRGADSRSSCFGTMTALATSLMP